MRIIIRVALLHQSSVSGTKARFFPFVPGLLSPPARVSSPRLLLSWCTAAAKGVITFSSPLCHSRRQKSTSLYATAKFSSSSPPKRS